MSATSRWTSRSERDTIDLGRAIGRTARAGDIVALDGELGAGKTRLVRGIVEGMGLDADEVSSPTYVLVNEHAPNESEDASQTSLLHVDAYRLTGSDELDSVGWDIVDDGHAVVVIEWAERIADALPKGHLRVRIEHAGETERVIHMIAPRSWTDRPEWGRVLERTGQAFPQGWTRCPITGRPVHETSPTFPFIDERARLADLNKWLDGGYQISRDVTADDINDD